MLSHGGSGGKPPARRCAPCPPARAPRLRGLAALPSARPCAPFALTLTCSGRAARPCGLASDAPPLLGGEARSGSIRRLPIGRLHCVSALAARSVRCPPIGRHHCALRSRRRAPANGSGDVAVSPDARLRPRVGAATPERSHGSRSRSPRLSRGRDTLRPGSGYARIDFVRTKSPGPRRKAAPAGQPPPRLPGESMRYNRMRGRFAAWAAPTV